MKGNFKTINLSDTVMVSDPCYTEPTWCQAKFDRVKPGEYYALVKKHDAGDWGIRNSMLLVIHKDHINDNLQWKRQKDKPRVGVDSGQAGIFSYDTYRKDDIFVKPSKFAKQFPGFEKEDTEGERWYGHMCDKTLGEEGWGTYFKGVVARSGFGDGEYDFFVARVSRRAVAIAIDFAVENTKYIDFDWWKNVLQTKIIEK